MLSLAPVHLPLRVASGILGYRLQFQIPDAALRGSILQTTFRCLVSTGNTKEKRGKLEGAVAEELRPGESAKEDLFRPAQKPSFVETAIVNNESCGSRFERKTSSHKEAIPDIMREKLWPFIVQQQSKGSV
ncbi:hypothetical protein J6590_066850 [Homalodisca vitripennis]|nr:hypothetical protein J6590_066850 [Homalodisca vitripennis]